MKKVVSIVLNNFTNDSRVLKENVSLKKAGYDVIVVALYANGLAKDETVDGVRVIRVELGYDKEAVGEGIRRFLNYISFIRRLSRYVNSYSPDIVHCNDIDTLPVGVYIKKFINNNIKIVYDSHEYQTEQNLNYIMHRLIKLDESYCIKYADRVITVSNSIAEEYKRIYKIDKPCLVLNSPNIYTQPQKKNLLREKLGIKKKSKIIIFQGMFGKIRKLDVILDCFMTRQEDNVVIVFMGWGELINDVIYAANNSPNIFYQETVSIEELLDYTSSADYGIALVSDECLSYKFSLPNKFFEYAMAGLPIISSGSDEMKAMIDKYQMGVVARDISVTSIDTAINEILNLDYNLMSNNARRCAEENSWDVQEKKLLELYSTI
ncbi:glycosyltransferase family 4 protein [Francisella philomiragia]|uniref:glycosyltransferase family 4 protein n=1 Tax=Francisella philomiragia TaxID=28110 RepID=UPI001904C1D7|nr:glycosyltransferase family 4 protein [Francisella philomiragia]MBK2026290.1 glycosyltransferase family 4 protein [Francisella philomiragia]